MCVETDFPNNLAAGGGTYVETDSSGNLISSGIYRIADTPGSVEGLATQGFLNSSGSTT